MTLARVQGLNNPHLVSYGIKAGLQPYTVLNFRGASVLSIFLQRLGMPPLVSPQKYSRWIVHFSSRLRLIGSVAIKYIFWGCSQLKEGSKNPFYFWGEGGGGVVFTL